MSLAFWRDIAVVWLALLCLIGMAVPLAAAVFAVKGMGIALDHTPGLFGKAQAITGRVRAVTETGSRETVTRILHAQYRVQRVTNFISLLGARRTDGSR